MTIQFMLQILKYMALWSLFIDSIDLSQGYVPLLSCRLLAGPEQPPPAPACFFLEKKVICFPVKRFYCSFMVYG